MRGLRRWCIGLGIVGGLGWAPTAASETISASGDLDLTAQVAFPLPAGGIGSEARGVGQAERLRDAPR